MQDYFVQITNTFGGEANYSWVENYRITANGEVDAISKIPYPFQWVKQWDDGTVARYDSKSGLTCLFISEYYDDEHNYYRVSVIN